MKLIGLYQPNQAISIVYCPTCFTILKLNNKIKGWSTVETTAVPGLSICFSCGTNEGPTQEQLKIFVEQEQRNKVKK